MKSSRPARSNLPDHGLKTKHGERGTEVFDPWRGRWVALTPEEWVRQHFLNHLVHDLGYPAGRMAVEQALTLHTLTKRTDAVVYGADRRPQVLIECKAPGVRLDQAVFEQAARYNMVHKVRYLMITNGLQHFCCVIDMANGRSHFLRTIPAYADLEG